ncbi:MAG: lytic transglycosylase domain-containing protein [Nitrospirales bacterium]
MRLRGGFMTHAAAKALICSVALVGVWGLPGLAVSEIYRYVEPDGTMSFTNVPTHSRFKLITPQRSRPALRLHPEEVDRLVARHSQDHRLHPALLRAVMKAESDFNPTAVSRAGAVGLMQLMPATAARLNVVNPYDPEENVRGGAQYLRYLLDLFEGNLTLALAAYNAGENLVAEYQALPPIHETRRYVAKVLRYYRTFLTGRTSSSTRAVRPFSPDSPGQPLVFSSEQLR